jgi:LysR family transcriptional regulator (chromosome initiation inhibitor)
MNSFDPDALECLAAIVEEGGFERAALRLSITQSAVSQRLRALESQAGTVLIVRSRPVRPTLAGQLLLKHAKMSRLLRADLELELRGLAPSKVAGQREHERVAIAINADSIACWALPALNDLARQGLPLELITDDQDFTLQWLREGQVLGCVTALSQPLRGCRVQALGAMEYLAVAERGYAQKHLGPLRAGAALMGMHNFRSLPFVAFNRKDSLPAQLVARALGLKNVNLQSQVLADLSAALQAAAARELRAPQALAPKVFDPEALAAA